MTPTSLHWMVDNDMHDATGPEPDYRPSNGPTMISIPLVEYEAMKRDLERYRSLIKLVEWISQQVMHPRITELMLKESR